MADVTKIFDKYEVFCFSTRSKHEQALILCYAGTQRVGIISFHLKMKTFPKADVLNDKITLHYTLDQFRDVIDLLRNEKPLRLWCDTTKNIGFVGTGTTGRGW